MKLSNHDLQVEMIDDEQMLDRTEGELMLELMLELVDEVEADEAEIDDEVTGEEHVDDEDATFLHVIEIPIKIQIIMITRLSR